MKLITIMSIHCAKPSFADYSEALLRYLIRKRRDGYNFYIACYQIGKTPDLVRRILAERKIGLQIGMIKHG